MKYYLIYKYTTKDDIKFIKYEQLISSMHTVFPSNFPGSQVGTVDINCDTGLINLYGEEQAQYSVDSLLMLAEMECLKEELTPEYAFEKIVWPSPQFAKYHIEEPIKDNKIKETIENMIVNNFGINLCSVDNIDIKRQEDGQLKEINIKFIPNKK